jgi:hypothetical protein
MVSSCEAILLRRLCYPSVRRRGVAPAVREFVVHYHYERNHQGLGNVLIFPRSGQTRSDDLIVCRERLGGLLKYYHRPVA